ncbi:glutathione S-transferase family protein [Corallococcus terminator]|uniref:Glutathione S-transferase family protein n=2 Tax=Corallococcus terminator TaxID=2316733 RepID=A0A3A8JM06_9BACT|nr:glutathione S-transferase family protein [Corallococcus terminator]
MMRTLHFHPLSSFCQKVLVALYELGLPFERRFVDLGAANDREALARLWPFCRFPVLEDDGRVVAESSIIVEHLGPGLIPTDRETALECRFLDRVFDLHVNEPVGKIVTDRLRPEGAHDVLGVERARDTLRTAYGVLDARLRGRTWAAGDAFTLADCAAAPALFYAVRIEPLQHPHLTAYFERLLARPPVARVFEEARPYLHLFPVK